MEFWTRKKLTFLALIMGALLLYPFAPKSALAQLMDDNLVVDVEVASNGIGDLLIFPYWTTMNRDTIIEITNTTSHTPVFTHVRFLDMAGEVLSEFTIGLCERDVWTAVLTAGMMTNGDMMTMLKVVSPGKADGKVDDADYEEPPMEDDDGNIPMLEIGDATAGYIEVFSMAEEPDAKLVENSADPEDDVTQPQADALRTSRDVITGAAFILNTDSGKGESVPPTALVGFNAINADETPASDSIDDNDKNEDALVAGSDRVTDALAREGGVDKEILITHFNINPNIAGSTMLVVTFPTEDADIDDREEEDNPVSIFAIDTQGFGDYGPVSMELDSNVNMLDMATLGDDADRSDIGYRLTEGWLRILDSNEGERDDFPMSRLPAIGRVFQSVENGAMSFNQSYPWQWSAMVGAGGYIGHLANTGTTDDAMIRTGTTGTSLKPEDTMFRPWYHKVETDNTDPALIVAGTGTDERGRLNRYALPNFTAIPE